MTNHNSWQDDPQKRQKWIEFMQSTYPSINPSSVRLMDEIRKVAHKLFQIGERSIANAGISSAQFRLLLSLQFAEIISGRTELNPSEISSNQGTSRNTISGLIRSLEEKGYVERRLDMQDRRRFNIGLTAEGKELVLEHMQIYFEAVDQGLRVLSADDQDLLSALLNKIQLAFDNPNEAPSVESYEPNKS